MTTLFEAPVRRAVAAGLCSTCEHAPTCTHAREPGVPILECDDAPALAVAYVSPFGVAAKPRLVAERPRTLRGLCGTCVRRADCTYPKPEGGVWRCEEFE